MHTIISLFRGGGVLMWPLLLCSLVSVTVTIERGLFWLQRTKTRHRLAADLFRARSLLSQGDVEGAGGLLSVSTNSWAAALSIGLSAASSGSEGSRSFAEAVEQAAVPIMRICRRGLRVLDTVITVAPLLGLLGTVVGVIQAFGFVGTSGGNRLDMRVVGGGIAEALITTAFGLAIAIVTVVPYNYFSSRTQREAEELSTEAASLEEALHDADSIRA